MGKKDEKYLPGDQFLDLICPEWVKGKQERVKLRAGRERGWLHFSVAGS